MAAGRVGRRTVRTNPAQHRAGADSIELHHESSKANARPCAPPCGGYPLPGPRPSPPARRRPGRSMPHGFARMISQTEKMSGFMVSESKLLSVWLYFYFL